MAVTVGKASGADTVKSIVSELIFPKVSLVYTVTVWKPLGMLVRVLFPLMVVFVFSSRL